MTKTNFFISATLIASSPRIRQALRRIGAKPFARMRWDIPVSSIPGGIVMSGERFAWIVQTDGPGVGCYPACNDTPFSSFNEAVADLVRLKSGAAKEVLTTT